MASKALNQLLMDTAWGELDYLVVDLPPGTSDIHITISQQFPITGAVVVTTPQEVALADVRKAISMFIAPQINVPVLGVVENMAWFESEELPGRKFYLFGNGGGKALADEYNYELLAQIPITELVREAGDAGEPAATRPDTPAGKAFAELAGNLARQIAIRTAHIPVNA
jgi:ATP-binding protein involved in chromosome partitioning